MSEAKATIDWSQPKQVDTLTQAFGCNVIKDGLMPLREDLPDEFRSNWYHNEWCRIVEKIFFSGGHLPTLKKGIDKSAAYGHFRAIVGSFEPSHEHKVGALGYLLSLWCEATT